MTEKCAKKCWDLQANRFRLEYICLGGILRFYPGVWGNTFHTPVLPNLPVSSEGLPQPFRVGLCPFHSEDCLWQCTPKFLFLQRVTSIYFLFIYLFYQFLVFAHCTIECVNSLRSGEKLISEPMKQPSQ